MPQQHVPFEQWFAKEWKRADESRTRALARLEARTGLAAMTLRRAIKGQPLRAATARALARVTSGRVSDATLALGASVAA